jgi:hypothetical protein
MSLRGTATGPAPLGEPNLHRPATKLGPVDVGITAYEPTDAGGRDIVERPDSEQEDDQVAGIRPAWIDYRR